MPNLAIKAGLLIANIGLSVARVGFILNKQPDEPVDNSIPVDDCTEYFKYVWLEKGEN